MDVYTNQHYQKIPPGATFCQIDQGQIGKSTQLHQLHQVQYGQQIPMMQFSNVPHNTVQYSNVSYQISNSSLPSQPRIQQSLGTTSNISQMQQLQQLRQIQMMQQQRQIQSIQSSQVNTGVSTGKLTALEKDKTDLFSEYEHDTGNNIYYGDSTISNLSLENTSKKYFKRLYSLNIPTVVKSKVEEYIVSTGQRIHVIDDEVLCAKVINAYRELNIPYDEYDLFTLFGIDPRRTKVHEYISNTSTRNSAIVEAPISISLSVTDPSKYIPIVLDNYVTKHQVPSENIDLMKQRIINLCKLLCQFNKLLLEEQPYNIAAAFVFLFIKEMTNVTVKKSEFSQKIFSELPNVDTKKFSKVYKIVLNTFNTLKQTRPDILTAYISANYF
jgi:hypothetical protein